MSVCATSALARISIVTVMQLALDPLGPTLTLTLTLLLLALTNVLLDHTSHWVAVQRQFETCLRSEKKKTIAEYMQIAENEGCIKNIVFQLHCSYFL